MLESSRAQNTIRTYRMAWTAFQSFRNAYHFNTLQDPNVEQLALFISYMSCHKYSASTIATYMAGLSFCLRSRGLHDITQVFPIRHLIEGCRRLHTREDIRCPITLNILKRLINVLPYVCENSYDQKMYTAAFLLAFFGFLRISEFTATSRRVSLGESDVIIKGSSPHRRLLLSVRFSKTDQRGACGKRSNNTRKRITLPCSGCTGVHMYSAKAGYSVFSSFQYPSPVQI